MVKCGVKVVKTMAEKLPLKRLLRKKRGFDSWLEMRVRYAAGYTARDARARRTGTANGARTRQAAHGHGTWRMDVANHARTRQTTYEHVTRTRHAARATRRKGYCDIGFKR